MIQLGLKAPKEPKKIITEKYDYPVITLLPTNDGKSHMINFNKACIEAMELNESTMIVFGKMDYYTFFVDGQSLGKEHDSIKRKFYKDTGNIMSKFDYEEILKSNKKLEIGDKPRELKVTIDFSEDLEMNVGKLSYINNAEIHGEEAEEEIEAEVVVVEEVIVEEEVLA